MSSITVGAHSRPAGNRWTGGRRTLTAWRRRAAEAGTAVAAHASRMRQPALTVTGLGLVDASAFQVGIGLGLLVTGASALVLEWLTSS